MVWRACAQNESQAAKWAAACARFTFWDVIAMSYPHWEPVHSDIYFFNGDSANGAVDDHRPQHFAADMAIDSALRSVPLPDEMLSRLDKFVHAMIEGTTDSVDYLGC